jgi:hypothetical protein
VGAGVTGVVVVGAGVTDVPVAGVVVVLVGALGPWPQSWNPYASAADWKEASAVDASDSADAKAVSSPRSAAS